MTRLACHLRKGQYRMYDFNTGKTIAWTTGQDEDNARFIVRACNCHDELVAASQPFAGIEEDNPPASFQVWVRWADVLRLRAALVKAGEA